MKEEELAKLVRPLMDWMLKHAPRAHIEVTANGYVLKEGWVVIEGERPEPTTPKKSIFKEAADRGTSARPQPTYAQMQRAHDYGLWAVTAIDGDQPF